MAEVAPGLDFAFFFWILLLLMFLYPQMRYRMLETARLRIIRRIEQRTGSRVVTMIHRQERITFFGIPFYRFIDIEDSEQILRAIHLTPRDMPLTLILHTPGGLVLAAAQIAMALKKHPAKTTVVVPHYAMSGGTLIALAADEIIMDENAVLGPVDPQLGDVRGGAVPAASILRVVEMKGPAKVRDETLVKADIAEKAIRQMEELIYELTADKLGEEKARELAKTLATGKWTHDYPLTVKRLRELGIEVKTEIPEEVYQLMALYPQPAQARPTVEYIPMPYQPRPRQQTK